MKTVIFICTGNTCRSPMAEGIFNKLATENNMEYHAISAGFECDGLPASENSIICCRENGIDISKHQSQILAEKLLDNVCLIVPMTELHKQLIIHYFPEKEPLIHAPFDVDDPYGGDLDEYKKSFEQIKIQCENLIDEL